MIFCNRKTCPDNIDGQRCGKTNIVLYNGVCRDERDRILRWLDVEIEKCEIMKFDDRPSNFHCWSAMQRAFQRVREKLEEVVE